MRLARTVGTNRQTYIHRNGVRQWAVAGSDGYASHLET